MSVSVTSFRPRFIHQLIIKGNLVKAGKKMFIAYIYNQNKKRIYFPETKQ